MSPGKVSTRIVLDRCASVTGMLDQIGRLPLGDAQEFMADTRNVWTVDSCLRRALEALFDIGRHILAKGYAEGVSEYKEIARRLGQAGVLESDAARTLERLAGYRNRLVHFYHEVHADELYEIASRQRGDLAAMRDAFVAWLKAHPELVDGSL